MTQNLKIEVLTGDISIDGMVVTNLVTKEELSTAIVKKADLGTDGKIPTSQLPAEIVNTAGIVDEVKLQLETSIEDAVDESNAYAESYTDNALSSKADLTSGKVPLEQLPTIDQYPQFGTALSSLSTSILTATKQRTDQLEKSKADLGEDGKVLREQIPSYEKISGLPEQLEVMSTQTAAVSGELDEHKLQTADQIVTLTENINSNSEFLMQSMTDRLENYADKDAVKRGIANRYDSSLTYNSGERVVLANGDIVKSTIDGNVVNPNANMTGWVKTNSSSQIIDASGLTQQDFNDSALIKSPQFFGAKCGANDDQVAFTNLSTDYAYALGAEYTVPVWRTQATRFIGNGTKVNLDSVNGDTTVCLQIKPNSNYSDIDFVNNPNQAKAWTYSVIGNNSVLTNVGFYNFYDNAASKNSWGVYLENRNNITLNSPKFGGNGLSDIAILDNVKNVTIVNATNTVEPEGVRLDIEPNNAGNIRNINVIGGKYAAINVLENSYSTVGIQGLNVIGAEVGLLELRGGQTKLINSKVDRIKGNWANTLDFEGMQNEYFCSLEVDGFNLSQNLFEDEFMNSLSGWDTNSFFSLYAPTGVNIIRKKDDNGYYLSINANKVQNYHVLTQRGFTSLPLGADVVCIAMAYSVENSGTDTMFQPCLISFFNDSDVQVGARHSLKGGRTAAGTNYNWSHEVSIFDIPAGATKCKIAVRNNKTGSTLKVRKIGVHTLTKTDGVGNFNAVVASYALPNLKNSYKQVVLPVDKAYGYDGLLVETLDATYKYVGSGSTFTLQLVEKVKVFGSAYVNVSIPANTSHTETKTITGAKVGQTVSLSPNGVIGATVQLWGEVTAVDTVALYLRNNNATPAVVVTLFNIVLE